MGQIADQLEEERWETERAMDNLKSGKKLTMREELLLEKEMVRVKEAAIRNPDPYSLFRRKI